MEAARDAEAARAAVPSALMGTHLRCLQIENRHVCVSPHAVGSDSAWQPTSACPRTGVRARGGCGTPSGQPLVGRRLPGPERLALALAYQDAQTAQIVA